MCVFVPVTVCSSVIFDQKDVHILRSMMQIQRNAAMSPAGAKRICGFSVKTSQLDGIEVDQAASLQPVVKLLQIDLTRLKKETISWVGCDTQNPILKNI